MWIAIFVSLFSYLSIEMIAVSAGEAKEPQKAVPIALRSAVVRLVLFYLLTLSLMLVIVPWSSAGVMNFVILVAALSAMNSQLYISTRMMFSLSRAGFAPKILGKLNKSSVPAIALATSVIGIAIATVITIIAPPTAFGTMVSISSFGAMFTWFMIFITHLFFRKKWKQSGDKKLPVRMIGYPYLTILGAVLLLAVVISTWFSVEFKATLIVGVPWLIFITIAYFIWKNINSNRKLETDHSETEDIL